MEEFSRQYKKKLDEAGALGKIPDDLALEVTVKTVVVFFFCKKIDNGLGVLIFEINTLFPVILRYHLLVLRGY